MHATQTKSQKTSAAKSPVQCAQTPDKKPETLQKQPAYTKGLPQRKVAIGSEGDSYEQEADSVAQKVASGGKVAPDSVSSVNPAALSRMTTEEKKPEPSQPVQKADDKKKPDEPKPLQKAEMPKQDEKKPEAKPAQKAEKKPDEPKPLQKAGKSPEEQKPLQKSEAKNAPGTASQQANATEASQESGTTAQSETDSLAMSNVAEQAIANKGMGRPLNPATMQTLSERMGVDLKHVMIHDDAAAQEACRALHARAFTHGSDIWLGTGESDTDLTLMAHEVTHVIQQTDHIHRKMLQRDKKEPAQAQKTEPKPDAVDIQEPLQIEINKTPKIAAGKEFKRAIGYDRKKNDPRQSEKWDKEAVSNEVIAGHLKEHLGMLDDHSYKMEDTGQRQSSTLIGNPTAIAPYLKRPWWNREGTIVPHDVDHIIELVLTNWRQDEWGNSLENMEMLDSKSNRSNNMGKKIDDTLNREIKKKGELKKKYPGIPDKDLNVDNLKQGYTLVFKGAKIIAATEDSVYTQTDIQQGEHIKALAPKDISKRKVKIYDLNNPKPGKDSKFNAFDAKEQAKYLGSKSEFVLHTSERGGRRVTMRIAKDGKISDAEKTKAAKYLSNFDGVKIAKVEVNPGSGNDIGTLTGEIFTRQRETKALIGQGQQQWAITPLPGSDNYAGYIKKETIRKAMSGFEFAHLSPIVIKDVELDESKGLRVTGYIDPSVPLLSKLNIDLILEGNDLRAQRTFYTNNFAFPGPIKLTSGAIILSIGTTSGVGIKGGMDFEIANVGTGNIHAGVSTGKGFDLGGEFNFDPKLLGGNEARLEAWYRKDGEEYDFGLLGELKIKENKIKGVKTAQIHASYTKGKFSANGEAELTLPGVEKIAFTADYSPQEGLVFTGDVLLKESKFIQSGSGKLLLKKKSGEELQVGASGKVIPKLSGISAQVDFSIDNDLYTVEGTAAYAKGMLSGSILIGVTNRPVGDDGKPGEGKPLPELLVYGGGSLSLKLAPWLQATAGIKLLPNGEVEVMGKIGIPGALKLFDEKKLEKNIFKINVDIPILGVSAAGQNIGIFATIGGGLDLSAGIGPGELQDTDITVTYNPAHEEDTHVVGRANLHVPAHAGLRLFVRGGLGVGIPLVDATAGLEVGASLGLEGALHLGTTVDWSPKTGLVIDAVGSAFVEPKFKFDVSAFVLVELDLVLKTITLYENKWELASFEWGSGLRFGVEFPIHYEEGKAFDISMDKLKFTTPDINAKDVLSGLVEKIVG